MSYLYVFKALHIIGFVAWFAGLFYLGRLLIYHAEAQLKPDPEKGILSAQYALMETRLYKIITNPAMMLTWTCGIIMLVLNPDYLSNGWMHVKLLFLVILLAYHLVLKRQMKNVQKGVFSYTDMQLRLFNEFPLLLLVGISFSATLGIRGKLVIPYLIIGLLLLSALIYLGIRANQKKKNAS